MSLTPMSPNLGSSDRKFWSKPDSLFAWLVVALAGAAVIYGWGSIVPFLLSMMVDTLHLVLAAAGVILALVVLTSKRTWMLLRLLSRYLTNLIIPCFPIEILKDRIQQMKKRRDVMEQQISSVRGQIGTLKGAIEKNHNQAMQKFNQAEYAKKSAASSDDANETLRMQLQMKVNANKAGRLEKANVSYQDLLNKLQSIYNMLVKWAANVDAYIEDTEDEVRQEEIKYKTINAAYKAYRTALSVIKGNAVEEDVYNTTMQFLADEAGRKLGEMEDFQRVAQNFMDNMDVQNGAITDEALQQLNQYEQKLVTSGNQETAFLLPGAAPQAIPVGRNAGSKSTVVTGAGAGGDYTDIFK